MQTTTSSKAPLGGQEQLLDPVEHVIVPTKRRLKLRDLHRHRSVIRILSVRDFKAKYKQSMLGPIWLVFQPVALLLVFLVAFRGLGRVQSQSVPYVVFSLVGLTAWSFFQAATTIGTASIVTNSAFVRYTPCPRIAFPTASLIASLPSYAITAAGAIVGAAITGVLSPRLVLLPIVLAWLMLLTAAIVAMSASLAVRYRDVMSALPFLLQLGLFIAPVGYSLSSLSPTVRTIVEFNPLTGVIEASRWVVIAGYNPSLTPIVLSVVITTAVAVLGWRIFARAETTMADVI
jgi:lipopolysaccharide transport system permease protein